MGIVVCQLKHCQDIAVKSKYNIAAGESIIQIGNDYESTTKMVNDCFSEV